MSSPVPSRSTVFATNLVTLLLVLTAAFGLYVITNATIEVIRGGGEVVTHQMLDLDPGKIDALPAEALITRSVPVTLHIRDASNEQVLYGLGRDIVPVLLIASVLWLLRKILVSVRLG